MPKINRDLLLVFFIALALFLIPFFWFGKGELDLGGDSSRLYFYNPEAYLKATALFSVDPVGTGRIVATQVYLPFLTVLNIIFAIFRSPQFLALFEKSIKLSLSFVFMFLIVRNMLSTMFRNSALRLSWGAILAGIFYTLSPAMTGNFLNALLIHNEMFLNPLMFYLLLRFCQSHKRLFLWFFVFLTFIFAPNFSLGAPPPLFSFYPLALLFLFLYVTQVNHQSFPWREFSMAGLMMVGLNAFHLIPVFINVMNPSSFLHARAFEASARGNPSLDYFNAILGLGKVSTSILLPSDSRFFQLTAIIPIALIVVSFIIWKRKAVLVLVSVFFLITLFLGSANITHLGVNFYRLLFRIPGFGMFRNFVGQWQFVYTFFCAILFGLAAGNILTKLKSRYALALWLAILLLLIIRVNPFISGQTVNTEFTFAKGSKATLVVDPRYDQVLNFIKLLPSDGKILSLPLTDFFMQVIHGLNNGVYIGPSPIAYLAGRNDFPGYITLEPFPDVFMRLSREEKYDDIRKLLSLLNIRYIFYNSDPEIYDSTFPAYPYTYMRTSLPKSQAEYIVYIQKLGAKEIYENGPYKIFDLGVSSFTPIVSIPNVIYPYRDDRNDWYGQNMSFFTDYPESAPQAAYVLKTTCLEIFPSSFCNSESNIMANVPLLVVGEINPTKYRVKIKNTGPAFLLILSNSYDNSWKVYLAGDQRKPFYNTLLSNFTKLVFNDPAAFETMPLSSIADKRHFSINGYANAWLIKSTDLKLGQNELVIETQAQQIFYISLLISCFTLLAFIFWGALLVGQNFYRPKNRT